MCRGYLPPPHLHTSSTHKAQDPDYRGKYLYMYSGRTFLGGPRNLGAAHASGTPTYQPLRLQRNAVWGVGGAP